MRLQEIMRTNVSTVNASDSADTAWEQMWRARIRHLVVKDNGQVVGVISERDLGGRHGEQTRNGRTVRELMSPYLVVAAPRTTLRQAANLMRGRGVGSLPVVENDRLAGIVTATDVLDELGRGFARPDVGTRRRNQRATPPNRRKSESISVRGRAEAPAGATGEIPAYIRSTSESSVPSHDRQYMHRKLSTKLRKFAAGIERVSVRVDDINGPHGGDDKSCRIKVVLRGLPSVFVENRARTSGTAFDGAMADVERAVRKALQRRRTKPMRLAA